MTNKELLDRLLDLCANRRSETTRAVILQEFNAAQVDVEFGPFHPWFLEAMAELPILAGQHTVALPTDFLIEDEDGNVRMMKDSAWIPLDKAEFEDLRTLYINSDPGVPKGYCLRGNELHVYPAPDADITISLPYFRKGKTLADDDNETEDWALYAPNWIGGEALRNVAILNLKDAELAASAAGLAQGGESRLKKYHEARKHTNADYNIGGPQN